MVLINISISININIIQVLHQILIIKSLELLLNRLLLLI